jgi:2-amino-4-hydroxy-6-hydroxymethyldihydropteridine diphosphokinase
MQGFQLKLYRHNHNGLQRPVPGLAPSPFENNVVTVTSFIALGSNIGDRRGHLDEALAQLRQHPGIRLRRVSAYYETVPVGGPPGQGMYLNAAAQLETDLPAIDLLRLLLDVEQTLGRIRREPDGPRTIDLDLLLYGNQVIDEGDLKVPHPRMHLRRFVLGPLSEIAPLAPHPRLGKSIRQLLNELPGEASSSRELTAVRALVTGSTSGIGRAIALELAQAGADVVVHGRRSLAAAEAVAGLVQSCGVQTQVLLADLRDPRQCAELVERAWKELGRIDVWINNAGADTLTGEAGTWPFEKKLAELLAVDVTATMLLSREAGRRMKVEGRGAIVNVGWDQAETGMGGDSGELFAAAKGAVMAFSRSLALSLAPQVRVNCVAPGWIRTAWGESASRSWQERVHRETPLERWGLPEDVARTVRWLVSPAAAHITGQTIQVNGGGVRS